MMKTWTVILVMLVFSTISFAQTSDNAISLDKVFGYRQVDKQGNTINVTILVNTYGLERDKTLKLKEKFPTGFQAKVTNPYGSVATVTEVAILFVWDKLPPSELFTISYQLTSATPLNESILINGNMSFLGETGIKYVSISQKDFMSNKDIASRVKSIPPYNPPTSKVTTATSLTPEYKPVVQKVDTVAPPKPIPRANVKEEPAKETTQNEITNQTEVKPVTQEETVQKSESNQPTETTTVSPVEPIHETVQKQEPVSQTTSENNNITEVKPISTVKPTENTYKPKPEPTPVQTSTNTSGVYYTVQIGASAKKLSSNYFAKYNFNKSVDENYIDGMYKYSVGQFSTLKEANSYQNYVKQKNVQCFVVAYNNGKKITIKEALAVSKQ